MKSPAKWERERLAETEQAARAVLDPANRRGSIGGAQLATLCKRLADLLNCTPPYIQGRAGDHHTFCEDMQGKNSVRVLAGTYGRDQDGTDLVANEEAATVVMWMLARSRNSDRKDTAGPLTRAATRRLAEAALNWAETVWPELRDVDRRAILLDLRGIAHQHGLELGPKVLATAL